jgi:hypothetical protein
MDRLDLPVRWLAILLAGLAFTLTLDDHTLSIAARRLVHQGLFITCTAFLLLPAPKHLVALLSSSLAGIPVLILLATLPTASTLPAQVLFQVCTVMFSLSLFFWSIWLLSDAVAINHRNLRGTLLVAVSLITSAPLWLGPFVDVFQSGEGVINGVIMTTPLTHFSVATEYDYLRSEWFYRNSPFGSLPFTYPSFISVVTAYLALSLSLQMARWGATRYRTHLSHSQQHSLTITSEER